MDHLSSEHKPGTDSTILMREGEVNRGPLKNDVSISMLILGLHQSNSFSLNSGTGYQSSAVLLSVGGRGQSRVTQHCHPPQRGQSPDLSRVDLLLGNSVGSSPPLKVRPSLPLAQPANLPGAFKIKTPKLRENFVSRAECGANSHQSVFQHDNSLPVTTVLGRCGSE